MKSKCERLKCSWMQSCRLTQSTSLSFWFHSGLVKYLNQLCVFKLQLISSLNHVNIACGLFCFKIIIFFIFLIVLISVLCFLDNLRMISSPWAYNLWALLTSMMLNKLNICRFLSEYQRTWQPYLYFYCIVWCGCCCVLLIILILCNVVLFIVF